MKDIFIPAKRIKKELIILLVCFGASILLNIYAITKYDNKWNELFSQLHIVILLTFAIYFLVLIFRLIFWGILKITKLSEKK